MSYQKFLAEAVATGTLIFAGAGAVLVNSFSGGSLGGVGIALAHGLAILVMVYAVAHISGAHINPAVTIALWTHKKIKTAEGVMYIVAQLAGAALAAYVLSLIFTGAPADLHLGSPALASGVGPRLGILIEAVLTGILMWTIMGVTDAKSGSSHHAGLAVGLAVTLGVLVGGSLTGAALNPARSFGPALVANFWDNHVLVYWVGPVLGAVVSSWLYRFTAGGK